MNILLINPNGIVMNTRESLPPGLGYIAAVIEKAGHAVHVLDLTVDEKSTTEIIDAISSADLCGITASTPTIKRAWQIAELCRKRSVPVVLGGPHVSALPEEAAHYCDVVVRGEGERTIVELLANFDKVRTRDLSHIAGLSYLKDGVVVHTPDRERIKDLNEVPYPAWHLFPPLTMYSTQQPLLDKNVLSAGMITSRGCPYQCVFCYKGIFGTSCRMRSADNVLGEWRMLVKDYRVKQIGIVDDSFTSSPRRVIEICKKIVDEKLVVEWVMPSGIRVKPISEEMLMWMKRAGCTRVGFGVESGSQRMLDAIQKNITLDDIRAAFRLAKKVGLETVAFFMIGNFGETEETMQATIDFAKELNPSFAQFLITVPYPGTKLYDMIRSDGRLLIDDWNLYGTFERAAYFETDTMPKELVERMLRKAYFSFYVRPLYWMQPSIMKRMITKIPHYASLFVRYFLRSGSKKK
ncbi:MAG: radical SAM protein [Spirochaetota bacterium]